MSVQYSSVAIGELLTKSEEVAEIIPENRYKQVTVKLWGKGVTLRGELLGAEIASSRQFVVQKNQFILSKIDARNGAFGLIPASLNGAIVSQDFPVFSLNLERALPEYLHWLSKTKDFVNLCALASEGTTNRVRLKIDKFLATPIPLPPLEEQRRIVTRIEELARKIEEAKGLRNDLTLDYESLCRSILFSTPEEEVTHVPLNELVYLREHDVTVIPTETYEFAGVYSFGRGVFRGQRKSGAEFAYTRLTRLHTNNFVYPKLMAWEGALGTVPPECDGLVVSPEFPVFEIDQNRVLPEVLDVYFRTPSIWPTLSGISTGTNVRRRRLNPSDFLSFKMPLPSMERQQLLKKVKNKIDSLKRKQAETEAELNALLPSILDKAFKGEL